MSEFVHGDNLTKKEKDPETTAEQHKLLKKIRKEYNKWKAANLNLKGPFLEKTGTETTILEKRVELMNAYKDFIDQKVYAEAFDARSNLHSSVLEEFIYYLFKDMVADISTHALIGKSHAYKDIFYQADSYRNMISKPSFKIEKKDHDFVIGVSVEAKFRCEGEEEIQTEELQIPAVAIECKTYLDKTMLEGASNAASQLLVINPNAIYIVVAERLKLTDEVNLKKYKVNQIYVLRKMKNTDRKYRLLPSYQNNPIYVDAVEHLFNTVRNHLTAEWNGSNSFGLERGYLI
jgi:hypothetical protein